MRDDVRSDGRLPGARRRDETEGSTVQSSRARMQQLEAVERRGEREHLCDQQSLPPPGSMDRARRVDPYSVRRDEMAPVVGCVDAVAEVGVMVDRHDESSVASAAVEHPLGRPWAPGTVELGGAPELEHDLAIPRAPPRASERHQLHGRGDPDPERAAGGRTSRHAWGARPPLQPSWGSLDEAALEESCVRAARSASIRARGSPNWSASDLAATVRSEPAPGSRACAPRSG